MVSVTGSQSFFACLTVINNWICRAWIFGGLYLRVLPSDNRQQNSSGGLNFYLKRRIPLLSCWMIIGRKNTVHITVKIINQQHGSYCFVSNKCNLIFIYFLCEWLVQCKTIKYIKMHELFEVKLINTLIKRRISICVSAQQVYFTQINHELPFTNIYT